MGVSAAIFHVWGTIQQQRYRTGRLCCLRPRPLPFPFKKCVNVKEEKKKNDTGAAAGKNPKTVVSNSGVKIIVQGGCDYRGR